MNRETAKYIISHYSNLLTAEERLAIRHNHSIVKLDFDKIKANNSSAVKVYKNHGWLTEDEKILHLLKDGYDAFELRVAQKIIDQNGDKVFLNSCPKCGKLTKTPFAKQCRFCQFDWHIL